MALGNYGELQTSVAAMVARADLTERIQDGIRLAEAEMQRTLRASDMEQRATSTATQYLAVPDDFHELRRMTVDGVELEPISSTLASRYPTPGTPKYYVILSRAFQLVPSPSSGTIEILYWKKITPLTTPTQTNWLLTSHPDLYLAGAVAWTLSFASDDVRGSNWVNLFRAMIEDLNNYSRRLLASGGPLVTRAA